MELIAIDIRANEDILGITVDEVISMLNQFADDTDVTLQDEVQNVQNTVNAFLRFEKETGLAVNYDKTTLYRMGSLKKSKAKYYTQPHIQWKEEIKVLGVTITEDTEQMIQKNYDPAIIKMKQVFDAWGNRSLSLIGKVMVINTLIASLLVYKMTVLPDLPNKYVKRIENLFRNYLWGGKKAKIALRTLQKSKRDGGLGLCDIRAKQASLKVGWIQVLQQDDHTAAIAYSSMGSTTAILKHHIWMCNLHKKDAAGLSDNRFWKQALVHWAQINYNSSSSVWDQVIWCNSYIRIQGTPIVWHHCIKKGLIWVSQLYPHGKLLSVTEASEFNLNFYQLGSLNGAIPKLWRDKCKEQPRPPRLCITKWLVQKDSQESYTNCLYQKTLREMRSRTLNGQSSLEKM